MSLKTFSKLVFEIESSARRVEAALKDYLLPYPAGLYLDTSSKPVIVPNQAYLFCQYRVVGNREVLVSEKPLVNYDVLFERDPVHNGIVYDQNGAIVFNQRKHRLLRAPEFPFRGAVLFKAYIDSYIERQLPWVKNPLDLETELQKHLKQEMREVSVAVVDIDEINQDQKPLKVMSVGVKSTVPFGHPEYFARRNYVMTDRVLISHPKYGQVLVPADLVEVSAVNPICEWLHDYLSSELYSECALLDEFIGEKTNSVYTTAVAAETRTLLVSREEEYRETPPVQHWVSNHLVRERRPTISELTRLASRRTSEVSLPPGVSTRRIDHPGQNLTVSRLMRVLQDPSLHPVKQPINFTSSEGLNDEQLGNQAHGC